MAAGFLLFTFGWGRWGAITFGTRRLHQATNTKIFQTLSLTFNLYLIDKASTAAEIYELFQVIKIAEARFKISHNVGMSHLSCAQTQNKVLHPTIEWQVIYTSWVKYNNWIHLLNSVETGYYLIHFGDHYNYFRPTAAAVMDRTWGPEFPEDFLSAEASYGHGNNLVQSMGTHFIFL